MNLLENPKDKIIVLTIIIVFSISFGLAQDTTEEDNIFTSEFDEEADAYLLDQQHAENQEELLSQIMAGDNNLDAEIALNIYIRSEEDEPRPDQPVAEEVALVELSTGDNDGERILREETYDFAEEEFRDLEGTDALDIEVVMRFEDEEEFRKGDPEANFTTEPLGAESIIESETTMSYILEYNRGTGNDDPHLDFYWGAENLLEDNDPSDSRLQDLTIEVIPPEVELVSPENESVFQSGEIIEFDIEDEFRDFEAEYTLNGEEFEFEEEFEIDTSDWEEGLNQLEVIAENEDGATTQEYYEFTVDDTPPDVNITNPEDGEIRNETEFILEYDIEEENDIEEELYNLNDEGNETAQDGIELEGEEGENTLEVFAEDEAGNIGSDFIEFEIDTEPPELNLIEPENITYDSFEVPISFESDEDTVDYEIEDDEGNIVEENTISENITTELEERDQYFITMIAQDDAGNIAEENETFTVDPDPPFFEVNITDTNSPVSEGEILEVEALIENIGDEEDTQTIEFLFDNNLEDQQELTLEGNESSTEIFEYDTTGEEEEDYEVEVTSEDDSDNETVGIGDPETNLTNIRIFDVSEEEDKRQNGELKAESTEELILEQEDRFVDYRFEFNIENVGSQEWELGEENITHQPVNESWELNDIYYQTEEKVVEGGDKIDKTIEWSLEESVIEPGEAVEFKYIITTNTTSSNEYDLEYQIDSEDENLSLTNNHIINKTKYGFLETVLEEPPSEFTAATDSNFTMDSQITCLEGECGEITSTSRYNESEDNPDTAIPEESTEDTPVFTTDPNPQNCDQELTHEDECSITWNIEVEGEDGEVVALDSLHESNLEEVENSITSTSIMTIGDGLILEVEWEEIDFGVVSPGVDDQPAQNNSDQKYNITIPDSSLEAEEINIKGTNLNSTDSDDEISVGNISYGLENDPDASNALTEQYQILKENVDPGTTFQTYYWLDVPTGIEADTYTGKITIQATAP